MMSSAPNTLRDVNYEHTATQKTFFHYLLFWIGQMSSLLGSSIVSFALVWWLALEVSNAATFSIAFFLNRLPTFFIVIFAGPFIDRLNRKTIILVTDSAQVVMVLLLMGLFSFQLQSFWGVFSLLIISSFFESVHSITIRAIIPSMIPKDQLSRMNSVNNISYHVILLISPPIAGFLISFLDISVILWIDVITYLLALIPTIFIVIPTVIHLRKQSERKSSFKTEMKEGYNVLMEIRGMRALFIMTMLSNFLLCPQGILRPYFYSTYHEASAQDYAIIQVIVSISLILGSILFTVKKEWKYKGKVLITGHGLIGLGYLTIACAPKRDFPVLWIGNFILLFGIALFNNMYPTILQENIPLDKQGRVHSLSKGSVLISTSLGILIGGPLADIIGINVLYIILASIFIFNSQIFIWFSDIRHVGEHKLEIPKPKKEIPSFAE